MGQIDILSRLEAASVGSRDLDVRILGHIEAWSVGDIEYALTGEHTVFAPPFSSSLDAALTLVPEGWGNLQVTTTASGSMIAIVAAPSKAGSAFPIKSRGHGMGATAALAVTLACLKARQLAKHQAAQAASINADESPTAGERR